MGNSECLAFASAPAMVGFVNMQMGTFAHVSSSFPPTLPISLSLKFLKKDSPVSLKQFHGTSVKITVG